jgi:hypothetical protein
MIHREMLKQTIEHISYFVPSYFVVPQNYLPMSHNRILQYCYWLEFAVDLDSIFRSRKPNVRGLCPVVDVFQLKIYWAEMRLCFLLVS